MVVTPSHTSPRPTPTPPAFRAWFLLLRPRQWIKNLVVFAGMIFKPLYTLDAFLATLAVFSAFCAVSSAGYIVNDILDAEKDRAHPTKCQRPIAAGHIRSASAAVVAVILMVAALGLIGWMDYRVALVLLGYLGLTLGYSFWGKHQPIIDIFAISGGFLLRAWGGTVAVGVVLSPWLFVCLFLLSLVLGFGKRRHELSVMSQNPGKHRPVLDAYSRPFIDSAMTAVLAASLVSYALYAITSGTARDHPALVYTVPVVCFAMLRYLYLVTHAEQGGKPEEIFLTDVPMIATIAIWGVIVLGIFLWHPG